ncbi:unnamed protein product [Cuscuta campestris]|uniref:Subtilisin-like protease fibronectin type-III domain-containing protein n=1 Tax=Cuscuta campestris TaxID=132261 RepID=A0A484MCE8_9ASTE|nr:unnamed protein product [Cuscuta campestris]
MESHAIFLFSILLLSGFVPCGHAQERQTYIVQLHPDGLSRSAFASRVDWHLSLLDGVISLEDDAPPPLLYSYALAMEGFSARLSGAELEKLKSSSPDVVSVRPDARVELQTTYSYKFLGLSVGGGAWLKSEFGRGTIVGLLDTGVWPESPSFCDGGMPPVPRKWKGICQEGQGFNASNCNKKLIGARFFEKGHSVASETYSSRTVDEYVSARDSHGHGTHTASIAGGAPVPMASVFENGLGEARGIAPRAHIAIYKVCWFGGCYSSDILAAMDAAISDGVDVLSLSLGGFPVPMYEDVIAIGSFRAVEHGITVVAAAGNSGPHQSSVSNVAPWITTVGASTMDRRFPAIVQLGNGKLLYGESVFPGKEITGSRKRFDLVYATGEKTGSLFCAKGSLGNVQGKMVVCDRGINGRAEKGEVVKESGGAAMILANTAASMEEDSVDAHVLPATLIGFKESTALKTYINSTGKPTARILFGGTTIGKSRAPAVAQFSSRGPSLADPSILKPDVIAPGVNIIAAWPQNLGSSSLPEDSRRTNFSVMSGTSMSCPHVSGLAALLRAAHRNWSPAAIKSALITTADSIDHRGKPITDGEENPASPAGVFAAGAGHVNPERAIEPGLIYDIKTEDYITHLCSTRFTAPQIFAITQRNITCGHKNRAISGLNYPSISIAFGAGKRRKIVVTRRVTNVGPGKSVYSVRVVAPDGVRARVKPSRLVFRHENESVRYRVWFEWSGEGGGRGRFGEGELTWVNTGSGAHKVRSPISVTWL